MHEIFDKVIEFYWGVWRYRWSALIAAWIIALLGWFMIAQIEARYPATARLFVDTNRILEPLLTGIAVQPNAQERIAIMSKTVLNRSNLNMLIDKHNLDQTPDGLMDRPSAIDRLTDDIVITDVNNRKSIYSLTYSHRNPEVAIGVLESLIEVFVSTSFDEERSDNKSAQLFLDKQIEDYDQRLKAAEDRLSNFKRDNAGSLPGEEGGYYQRRENLVTQQRVSQLALKEAVNQRDTLRANLAVEEQKITSSARTESPYDVRIAVVQAQLDDLLVRFTDRHPQVSILQKSLDDLRLKKLTGAQGGASAKASDALQASVVYQQLSASLAEAEGEVSKLSVRDASYQARLDDLAGTIDSIPEVEARFTQLDRDYETLRVQHSTLLNKRESARITSNIDLDTKDVVIRSLDSPFVPARPTDPDKLLLNILTLLASITLGVLFAFVLSILHPVFYNQRSLEHLMNIPVLGSVSLVHKPSERLSSLVKHLKFTSLAVLLPIVCFIILYIQITNDGIYESVKLAT